MAICLVGITAHVARKTTQPTEQKINHAGRLPRKNNYQRNYSVLSQSSSDTESDYEMFMNTSKTNSSYKRSTSARDQLETATAQPLLWHENESDFSSDEEAFQLSNLNQIGDNISMDKKRNCEKSWNSVSDDFFLRENRTWTSIKDAHVKMLNDTSTNNDGKIEPTDITSDTNFCT